MGSMKIVRSDATLGAYMSDIDLANLNESDFSMVEDAFNEYHVLVFEQANLNREQQLAFSRRFGRLERTLSKRTDRSGISLISNVSADGAVATSDAPLGLFLKGNRRWHTDSSFKVVSAKASILRAIEVPNKGGDTEWADMCAGWDSLDHTLKAQLENLVGIHSYEYSQGLVGGTSILREEEWRALRPVEHPAVRVHAVTQRKSIYVGRHISHFVGMSNSQSVELIERILDLVCQAPRLFRHAWKDGDVAMWDNRCVLHRGHPWDFREPRVMERTTVAGEGANPWAIEDSHSSETANAN